MPPDYNGAGWKKWQQMNSFSRLWSRPLLLALLSLSGLMAALIGDGVWDVFSWAALGIPVALMIKYWFHPAKPKE